MHACTPIEYYAYVHMAMHGASMLTKDYVSDNCRLLAIMMAFQEYAWSNSAEFAKHVTVRNLK